ncbi:dihydroorotate dehydrogenase, partial [Tremellales sp. Uapishka_1]
ASLPRSLRPGHLLAVNLGKNKTSAPDSNDDYVKGVRTLGPYADIVVINVSSPNTPGLRALQGREILEKLLKEVVDERDRIKVDGLPKIAVKVASDLSEEELGDVAFAVRSSGVEGVIVSNTTIKREGLGLKSSHQSQVGGLSGAPLFPYALHSLRILRPLLPPTIPLIGCGGITSGADAVQMAQAGASLIQVYTVFGYRGVGTPRLIKDEISKALQLTTPASQKTWKSVVKRNNSWNEDEIKGLGEKIKSEAKGLGDLLQSLDERQSLHDLIRESERALGLKQDDGAKAEEEEKAPAARDNLVGSTGVDRSRALAEGTPSPTLIERTPVPAAPPAHSIQEALASEPQAIDLTPIVVMGVPEEVVPVDEVDAWVKSAKSGSKRLV